VEYQKTLQNAAKRIMDGDFTVKDYYGLSDGAMEAIYMVGHGLYQNKQYARAKDILAMLSTMDPMNAKYMSAAGMACFMDNDFVHADQIFRCALVSGDYTPKTLMRLLECSVKLKKWENAKRYVDEVVALGKNKEFKDSKEMEMYSNRAAMIRVVVEAELIKKKKEESERAAAKSDVVPADEAEAKDTIAKDQMADAPVEALAR
jgi:hypothetical protein